MKEVARLAQIVKRCGGGEMRVWNAMYGGEPGTVARQEQELPGDHLVIGTEDVGSDEAKLVMLGMPCMNRRSRGTTHKPGFPFVRDL
jgi:hypothetical protein